MAAHLAIDLGAESGRCIVGVLEGGRVRLHEVHRFPHRPRRLPTGLHWDLLGLWGNVLAGTRKALAWAREEGLPLVSLGVDTWGVDYALLSASGELLGLPHAYRDPRNQPAFEQALARLGRERLYEATGIQFMALNTLFQLVAQRDADPGLLARAHRLLFMPDLMHFFFTGKMTVEASIASTSQMIDPRSGAWALSILEQLELPTHLLAETIPAGTPIGPLLPEIAAEVGADDALQVIAPAAHDTACAVAAVPADPASDWCYLSSGTWSLLGAELATPCLTAAAREVPFTNEGGVGGSIRFLKNITGLWLVQECRRELEQAGRRYDYDDLIREAAAAQPFRTLIDSDHAPFLTPGDMPAKLAAFARRTGQPEPTDPGQLVRCCLESLALTYRHTLERLEAVLDRRFEVLHVVGGGGRNRLLNQMTADATGRRVVVGPHEATALGNVLVQAMGVGDLNGLRDIRHAVAATVSPEVFAPRESGDWDRAFERFNRLRA